VTPIAHFEAIWTRCELLSVMQNYLARNVAAVMQPDELLRAEWVARVSALDLYVHELVAQRMLSIFQGALPKTPAYQAFKLPMETMDRIRTAATIGEAGAAFDLEVRRQLGFITYQDPERIAEGLRLCCEVELWNTIALHQGASELTKSQRAKQMKRTLSAIVERRNKIAHEGDLQPALPLAPWPVSQADLATVAAFVEGVVRSIDAVV
jgi:hypothetical protein